MKIHILAAIKYLALALVLVFLFSLVTQGKESATDFDTMCQAVIQAAETENMLQADNQMVRRLYGLDPGDYQGVLLYYPTTNMGAEELLVVKLADVSQQETVTAAIRSRIEKQKSSFDGYGVEQYAMLEKCVLEVQGNYILLVVAQDTGPVRQAFLDAL